MNSTCISSHQRSRIVSSERQVWPAISSPQHRSHCCAVWHSYGLVCPDTPPVFQPCLYGISRYKPSSWYQTNTWKASLKASMSRQNASSKSFFEAPLDLTYLSNFLQGFLSLFLFYATWSWIIKLFFHLLYLKYNKYRWTPCNILCCLHVPTGC